MSAQNMLPDPTAAVNNILRGAFERVFFQKVAAAGLQPRTAEEAETMLKTAEELLAIEQAHQVKSAAVSGNPIDVLAQAASSLAEKYGVKQAAAENEAACFAAADFLAQDPTLYNSVLAVKAAEADQAAKEFAAWRAQQQA